MLFPYAWAGRISTAHKNMACPRRRFNTPGNEFLSRLTPLFFKNRGAAGGVAVALAAVPSADTPGPQCNNSAKGDASMACRPKGPFSKKCLVMGSRVIAPRSTCLAHHEIGARIRPAQWFR